MAVDTRLATTRLAASIALLAAASSCRLAVASCKLPIELPSGAGPSGAAVGPRDSLLLVSDDGIVYFADLEDFTVRVDSALKDKYADSYGWLDLEGIAMTNPESSSLLYVGMENKPVILEYEWQHSHTILRQFDLPGLERDGVQSMAWVPTDASSHMGYFYVGSRATGSILIYELPLLEGRVGVEAQATLRDSWTPVREGSKNIAGLAHSAGYIFVSYNEGTSNHVLIYPVLDNGLYGDLAEQYQVDVADAQGMAVRHRYDGSWDVYLCSDSQKAVFVYKFRFVTGFELHTHCADTPHKRSGTPGLRSGALLALQVAALAIAVPIFAAAFWGPPV